MNVVNNLSNAGTKILDCFLFFFSRLKSLIKSLFKILWWIFLFGIFSYYLWQYKNRIFNGTPTSIDYLVFILWLFLLLYPLISEISIFGISIKKDIEKLKSDMKMEFLQLRNEINNTVTNQAIFQNNPLPSSDSKLKEMESWIKSLHQMISHDESYALPNSLDEDPLDHLPDEKRVRNLFKVRFILEQELYRIIENRYNFNEIYPATRKIVATLCKDELIDNRVAMLINEIITICNNAVHGRKISDEQYKFVSNVLPDILAGLKIL